MVKGKIKFYFKNIKTFPLPKNEIGEWISFIIDNENKETGFINFIFCDDKTLLEYNEKYLNHDTLTDVITFDYSNDLGNVSGDIFISKERVDENAIELNIDAGSELIRVIFHGVLHLLGYKDKGKKQREIMREREDFYLKKFSII